MDLGLNEMQEMLKKSAREFFEKECPRSLVRAAEQDASACVVLVKRNLRLTAAGFATASAKSRSALMKFANSGGCAVKPAMPSLSGL